jgi:hypothetical protein
MSETYLPSIEQGKLQTFKETFYTLSQQSTSKLASSPAIVYFPSEGNAHNMARLGKLDLVEVNLRNPDKQYGDYSLDNRQFRQRRFTRTITLDAKHDINEMIADPTSTLMTQLLAAQERVKDRVIVSAAIGSVLVGDPAAALSSISATTDGVLTVDASAGLTYEKIQEVTQNFINNEITLSELGGTVIGITGSEHTDLMGEVEFISNDYISGRPVEAGGLSSAGIYTLATFAGSVNGGITVNNPILTEGTTTRSCIALAPGSIALSMKLDLMGVTQSATKVNSKDLTVDLWINAMRTEGTKVQIITTTI